MSTLVTFVKDPDARLDYTIRWSAWLATGDTIASVDWAVTTGDVTIGSGAYAPSVSGTSSTVWIEGGTTMSTVRARITTTAGRIDDRSITVRIQER